ncbi:ALF repeat-containing protein [Kitasatospora sp. NPDC094015]|uniref:ALF repeat-containing protein n=1 Tax=Kitasatospora sp. NPDC094015 TaxID=3155205 RepID=UPI0033304E02
MKLRRSLAAAVFLATAAAPVAMAATPAFADTTPAGHEQTDPAETQADEANRAAIEKLLVYPNDYLLTAPSTYLREHAAAALAGTPADRAHFLAVAVDKIRKDDARIAIARIMNTAGPVLKQACRDHLDSDDVDVLRAFLKTGQFVARAEDENRAEVQRIIDDASSGPIVREAGRKALEGTAADVEQFLKAGRQQAQDVDDRLRVTQIMSVGGPAVRKAANAVLSGTMEDVREFLKTGQYIARAEDENRAEVQRIIDDPETGGHVREAARKALAGAAADVEHFLKVELGPLRDSDDRIRVSQIIEAGGPEVRKAGTAALNGTIEDVREFLKTGQYIARAKDKAAADAAAGSTGSAGKDGSGTTTVPASLTTGVTGTSTATDGSLASTGTTAPLEQIALAGAAAVALGAGTLVAARRRPQA